MSGISERRVMRPIQDSYMPGRSAVSGVMMSDLLIFATRLSETGIQFPHPIAKREENQT
jgi:hypothetical protein